ncbi:MAG: hypothetical protein Q8P34_03505 [Bacteroidota bacterium]|nr:hypothetical protein [Bacteroidota bacterium]
MSKIVLVFVLAILCMQGYMQEKTKEDILVTQINDFRKEKKIKSLKSDSILFKVVNQINKDGLRHNIENKDSLRKVLSLYHNFDYNLELINVELNNSENINLSELFKKYPMIERIFSDSLYNQIAYVSHMVEGEKVLSILASQNFIRFDEKFSAGLSSNEAGESGVSTVMKYDWFSIGGESGNKKPIRYSLYNDKKINDNEFTRLKMNQVEIEENGHFKIFIDLRLPENSEINSAMFFDNENRRIAKFKISYDE